MGDDAWLWKLSNQNRRFNYHGDTQWIRGKVRDKRQEGKLCLVELDMWCNSQRGEVTTLGQATVLLPSRKLGPVLLPAESGERQPTPLKTPYLADVPGSVW
jgi:hypothetical protein